MGEAFSPTAAGPGIGSQEELGRLLEGILGGVKGTKGLQDLFGQLSIPEFKGPVQAGISPLQEQSLQQVQDALRGGGALEGFTEVQDTSVDFGALRSLAGILGPTAGEERLTGIEDFAPGVNLQEIARTGGTQDITALLAAEEASSRRRIEEGAGNIRQQFARLGTRSSVGAQRAVGEFTSRSLETERGQRLRTQAGLFEGAAGRRLGAATELGRERLGARGQDVGIGEILARFGAQERTRATGAAGELARAGLTEAELGIRERGRAGGAALQGALLPGQLAEQAFGLGEQERGVREAEILRRQQEFIRTQGALFGPIINAILGQPTAFGPGIGSQLLGTATTVGGAAAGKGGGGGG